MKRLFAMVCVWMSVWLLAGTAGGVRGQGFDVGGGGGLGGFSLPSAAPVTARAALSVDPLVPGKGAQIAVEVTIDRRYHIQSAITPKPYIAAALTAKPVTGLTFGQVKYPVAHDVKAPAGLEGTLSVYEGKVYLLLPVNADAKPADAAGSSGGEIELSLLTQACDDKNCLPPKTLTLKVPYHIGAPGATQRAQEPALFAAATAQPYAPDMPPAATEAAAPVVGANAPAAGAINADLAGVKLLSADEQIALINARPYKPANSQELNYPLWAIVLLALAGGAILNVMPCVLPVIPLKALSLIQQAHGDRRLAVMHGLTFSAGVVTLFVALAIVLRTFGLFYGQQFQSAAFLIVMTYFVVALALSMLGVWTINPPQALYAVDAKLAEATQETASYQGVPLSNPLEYASVRRKRLAYAGSFGNGLMATLLATPCSAPFLGGVLAWALVQQAWIAALTLALVGVGMSFPYLVLAAFPSLLNHFPKAGRWSELLKQGLGIVMLGVAVYLITLIPNVQLWTWVMIGGVVVGLICWAWGQIPTPQMTAQRTWAIRVVALVVGVALGLGIYAIGSRGSRMTFVAQADGEWKPFNVALLDAALAEGRPVVVDWTASWCPNCHALEALVLSREAVQAAFARSDALLLQADLSEDNPPATALNRKLGSEAIPVLAVFSPRRPMEPVVLRDSYTQERVIDEVTKAK